MIKDKIGLRIKKLRLEHNLTQENLSLIAEIDRSYLAGVESGKRNISIENLYKITSALDVSLAVFFNDAWFR